MKRRKKIVILGSTGSVGESALKVVSHLPEELEVVAVAANSNVKKLAAQAARFNCRAAAVADPKYHSALKKALPPSCRAVSGPESLVELVTGADVDMVLCAIVGNGGLIPVIEAVKAGKDIALASKEVLVMAGEIVMGLVKKHRIKLLPVDSEHSAIFQCLEGKRKSEVSRLILTASGGPFRKRGRDHMRNATFETAAAHPVWSMGPKISIDSASMMNKALEIIEARWLFNVRESSIEAVIHPQSIIHSMVEFIDGTILAHMSEPDMCFPIQCALTHPVKHRHSLKPLDFTKVSQLTFETPDRKKFPSLDFAHEALRHGGVMPAVLNAANDAAVEMFRQGRIKFTDIWRVIEKVMRGRKAGRHPSLDEILEADAEARAKAFALKF
jgi:1-deoxy-D-xylulose-5-phosphate reductoisomerase